MHELSFLEECYKKYMKNLPYCVPEGIFTVDLKLLQKFNLLHFHDRQSTEPPITRYFHVIESLEKITLVNDQFTIWIVPIKMENVSATLTLIAINIDNYPKLELVFSASGVYNTSNLVLRILEKFLKEIQENEDLLNKYGSET